VPWALTPLLSVSLSPSPSLSLSLSLSLCLFVYLIDIGVEGDDVEVMAHTPQRLPVFHREFQQQCAQRLRRESSVYVRERKRKRERGQRGNRRKSKKKKHCGDREKM
jgi:hypothetical protein